ncbi:MAG: hypothetical protein ACTH0V_00735 [Microbacteriaceae bacterium]
MRSRAGQTALQAGIVAGSLVLIGVILWLDVRTTIWQEMVVVSGLAAGLVSFLLTTVFVHRIARWQLEARWAPVTHLALTELLHALADDERSDLSRGRILPRTLPAPDGAGAEARAQELDALRHEVLEHRQRLAAALGAWTQFLASTSDNDDIMRAAAELAWQFDQVRDATIEAEQDVVSHDRVDPVAVAVRDCNQRHRDLIDALHARLEVMRGMRA